MKAKADVNARSKSGETPIFSAPTAEICRVLVDRRASISALNEDGQSALHLAAKSGNSGAFTWLSSKASRTLCNLEDVHGATALDLAVQAGIPVQGTAAASSGRSSQDNTSRPSMTWPQNRSSRQDLSPARSLRQTERKDTRP